VVRSGATTVNELRLCQERLAPTRVRVLGTIMTDVPESDVLYGYGYE
jgi:hypothetical protein